MPALELNLRRSSTGRHAAIQSKRQRAPDVAAAACSCALQMGAPDRLRPARPQTLAAGGGQSHLPRMYGVRPSDTRVAHRCPDATFRSSASPHPAIRRTATRIQDHREALRVRCHQGIPSRGCGKVPTPRAATSQRQRSPRISRRMCVAQPLLNRRPCERRRLPTSPPACTIAFGRNTGRCRASGSPWRRRHASSTWN